MSQNLNQFPTQNSDNSNALDLVELWLILWKKKWLIIVLSFLSCAGILAYSLTLPNMYKSSVLLSPQQEQQSGGLSSLAGQFGGLASVAGINLGGSSDKTAVYLEIIKSKDFLYEFIEKNNVKVNLFTAKKWDKYTEALELDDTIYKNGKWLVDEETQETLEPTSYEAYEYFVKKLTVKEDKVTGLVEISFEHIDPRIAKAYVENIVTLINKSVREREIAEKKESIKYLNEELANTNIAEMQNVFYTIIEEQTKSMLLAKVRKEFAFKVIESPIVEEQKSSPNRAVICILGAAFSVFFICIMVLLVHFIRDNKATNART
ncbi:Wzz/FepE/Etk N-terminal domain-containing protein [Pseudoalteromonas sp. SA25]|uniref:Wzz/FepE/Etk N-terminal domain-containing protein n=1 Tax=Pseudoalteromonas sp. SA25 TaxID=2686347 RepID=UPI0013FD362E|nr:Wzz/FepE/Etk N-terminal domain-containing protein [Pseudoalteromonas sp. SA25]